jgi:integrase
MSAYNQPIKLRDGKLHLFKQPKSKNYFWRTFFNGKYVVRTTKTDHLASARSIAEEGYDRLRSERITPDGKPAHTWNECEQGLLTHLLVDEGKHPSRVKTYKVKLRILRRFFESRAIHTIKAETIEEYISWRKNTYQPYRLNLHDSIVSNKTLSADLLVLRQMLKYAKRREWITTIPDFPRLTITPRPRGWFNGDELVKLADFGLKWIKQAATPYERRAREYAFRYFEWLVFTGMRVDEALKVRFEDVEIDRTNPDKLTSKDCLFVTVKGGKLSDRKGPTDMIGLYGAVNAVEKLKRLTPTFQPKDRLFPVNPRETIRQLVDGAGLLFDANGQRRTARSFRHTFIMLRLLKGVDVYLLAKSCRTSVKMIEQHYGSHLTVRMNRAELTKMISLNEQEGRAK